MRFRRRFRRKGPGVIWADTIGSQTFGIGPAAQFAQVTLLPSAIPIWKGRSSDRGLTTKGIRMWLYCEWTMAAGGATAQMPPVTFSIWKTTVPDTGVPVENVNAFANPVLPSGVATWSSDPGEGTRDFLWTGRVFPSAPALVSGLSNTPVEFFALTATGRYTPLQHITHPFSPQVEVRTKRTMKPGDILLFTLQSDSIMPPSMSFFVNYAWRVWGA